ncbi:hypothetical protein ACFQE5_18425 [Pseudonocardia hispaniensis]|uniref:DUF485 domain-containing protein n=1 Tax=Pseudonocardia hispaniensis TaxID=904933 RepID=A0ABW1J697_9PSEU
MSTDTDGAVPSVSSGAGHHPAGQRPGPAARPLTLVSAAADRLDPAERDPAEQDPAEHDLAEQDPAERDPAERDLAEQDPAEQDVSPSEPTSGPLWLQAEIRRRMEANRSTGGGRHARREGVDRPGIEDYLGRDEEPGAATSRPAPPADPDRPTADLTDRHDPAVPARVRVVLSERKASVARSVRTVVDVQELTPVGDLLRTNLIGNQLNAALRVAAVAGVVLAVLPVTFAVFPELGRMSVLGFRLPWLLLGLLVYPFLLGLGWWYTRSAEKVEQEFADHVQD